MTKQIITRRVPGLRRTLATFAMLPGLLLASTPSPQQIELQKEGIQLIGQVEGSARDIRSHAARLDSFVRNTQISQQSHHNDLMRIRSSVNDELRPALDRLAELRPELPEWKQQSIQQMIDGAAALAADANDAILTATNGSTVPLAMDVEYKEFVSRVYAHADSLVKTSDAAGDYSSALLKAQYASVQVPPS